MRELRKKSASEGGKKGTDSGRNNKLLGGGSNQTFQSETRQLD